MSDSISREAAIDVLESGKDKTAKGDIGRFYNSIIQNDIDKLRNLPSVQPERIRGRWVSHVEKSREYIGTVLVNVQYDYWFCDTCSYRVENGQPIYNFCPNCGADMRETTP